MSGALRALSPAPVDPSPIITTARPFYGVSVGDLRRLARGWHREHPAAAPTEVAGVAEALWATGIREEMVVAALIHGHDAASRSTFGLRRADRWARLLDTWETTDQLGMGLVGPWVVDDVSARLGVVDTLSRRRNPWSRRLALVASVSIGRAASVAETWERVTALVLRLSDDREAAIPKAISWALRTHLAFIPEAVLSFVADYEASLPAVAVRDVRKKAATGKK